MLGLIERHLHITPPEAAFLFGAREMAVYVDKLENWGWKMRGRTVQSCHMFTDDPSDEELHLMAEKIGMKRAWFQPHRVCNHYDLTPTRRSAAVALGAIEVDRRAARDIWQARKQKS